MELRNEITIPDLIGKTVLEAQKILKEYKLQMHMNNGIENIDNQSIIKSQMPQKGITVYEGSYIYVDI